MNEWIGISIIGIGVVYDLLACIGLIRMPDVYTRLQTATKAVTVGTCFILIGAAVYMGFNAAGAKAMLCMIFVLLTNPTAAHAIARSAADTGVVPWTAEADDGDEPVDETGAPTGGDRQ